MASLLIYKRRGTRSCSGKETGRKFERYREQVRGKKEILSARFDEASKRQVTRNTETLSRVLTSLLRLMYNYVGSNVQFSVQ